MKTLIRITAVLLAVMMAVLTPLPALAAPKKEYIADIVTCTAATADEAKKKLEDLGYTMVEDSDISGGMKQQMYIGYKTTTNPDEAVTDIAMMNMNGPFSEARYKELLEEHRGIVSNHIFEQLPAIDNFQINYAKGTPAAKRTYVSLNNYIDDVVTEKRLGDYLLGFDFSDASKEELTDIFMKGNSEIILNIEKLLLAASETDSDTVIDRFTTTTYDDLESEYYDEYGSPELVDAAMANEYSDVAQKLLAEWDIFRMYLEDTYNSYVDDSDGSLSFNEEGVEISEDPSENAEDVAPEVEEFCSAATRLANDMKSLQAVSDFALYAVLSSQTYDSGTMLDYFLRPASEVEEYELYPLVAAMNEAQRAQAKTLGIKQVLLSALSNGSDEEAVACDEPISVYEGVDLSIFDDGVAFTDAALKREKMTGENWFMSLVKGNASAGIYVTAIIANTLVLATDMAGIIAFSTTDTSELVDYTRDLCSDAQSASDRFSDAASSLSESFNSGNGESLLMESYEEVAEAEMAADTGSRVGTVSTWTKVGAFIIFVVSLALDVYLIYLLVTRLTKEELAIPHHMVTAIDTKDFETYIYYNTVKNNGDSPTNVNAPRVAQYGKDANYGWFVMYATHDTKAGAPILADSIRVQRGSSKNINNDSFIHMFNENAAVNLAAKNYTGCTDDLNGVYVFFQRDSKAYTASAFSGGTVAAIAAGGFGIGILAGAIGTILAGKAKKRREAAVAAEN